MKHDRDFLKFNYGIWANAHRIKEFLNDILCAGGVCGGGAQDAIARRNNQVCNARKKTTFHIFLKFDLSMSNQGHQTLI